MNRSLKNIVTTLALALFASSATAAELSLGQARYVFQTMAGQRDIAYRFVTDGCFARAHLMSLRMQRMGIQPVKVWSFPHQGRRIRVSTALARRGFVEWTYHVAPAVFVRVNGRTELRVIDPSLFRQPVTVAEWAAKQKNTGVVRRTRLGEAPVLPTGRRAPGSGYWPGGDPREGGTAHALNTMRRYKTLEPRLRYGSYASLETALAADLEYFENDFVAQLGGAALPFDEDNWSTPAVDRETQGLLNLLFTPE